MKEYLPLPVVSFLKQVRHWFYTLKGFNHELAQKGELDYWKEYVQSDIFLGDVLSHENWQERIHPFAFPQFTGSRLRYFFNNIDDFRMFCKNIQDKQCLEIGSGAAGDLTVMSWFKKRIFIDPLIDEYRKLQVRKFGRTVFSQNVEAYSQEAEICIPSLENSVDGFILCVNTLDHCENPWLVLRNIGKYAAKGCKLLLWTDIWHLSGLNKEHRNITKDKKAFTKGLEQLGFGIDRLLADIRNDSSVIEFGCIATKL